MAGKEGKKAADPASRSFKATKKCAVFVSVSEYFSKIFIIFFNISKLFFVNLWNDLIFKRLCKSVISFLTLF